VLDRHASRGQARYCRCGGSVHRYARKGHRMGRDRTYSTLALAGSRIILIDILRMDGLGTTKDNQQPASK
jgi:hypothetical protein